jgi:hypothetical protein
MISFNTFKLRKDEAGQIFLDVEFNLLFAPQKTKLRLSIPASAEYQSKNGLSAAPPREKSADNHHSDKSKYEESL